LPPFVLGEFYFPIKQKWCAKQAKFCSEGAQIKVRELFFSDGKIFFQEKFGTSETQ